MTDQNPARQLLATILAIINRHEGRNAEHAMAEIHELLGAWTDPPGCTCGHPEWKRYTHRANAPCVKH
jgi:hypothetical protein